METSKKHPAQSEIDFNTNKYKTQPYKHQMECLNKFGRKHIFTLLTEMDTNKTWIIINNIANL